MSKSIFLSILSFLLFSCGKKEISNLPFEVTKDFTCNDLYDNNYKWAFGADVTLLGKKMKDTIIHYQIDLPPIDYDVDFNNLEENIPVEIDTVKKVTIYDKYLEKDALELSDSIYEFVYGSIEKQQKNICNEGSVSWRNFMLEIEESETKNFRNTINTKKYKILDIEKKSKYSIDKFKVVNLITRDTFNCSVYEQNKRYYFSSTFTLIKYE